jgi:NADH-quinone oxidoreductase subunit L
MEGPTPVSALIHSATMVGIGFLLLLKLSFLYQVTGYILNLIMYIGGFTSLLTNIGGVSCYDIKSINANSTGGQLGFMFLAYSSGNFLAAYYHYTTHAFYKALLFLTSGLIIQNWVDLQDVRLISPLVKYQLPMVSAGFIIGTTSLMGFPASLGSYSKEYVFELLFSNIFFYGFTH